MVQATLHNLVLVRLLCAQGLVLGGPEPDGPGQGEIPSSESFSQRDPIKSPRERGVPELMQAQSPRSLASGSPRGNRIGGGPPGLLEQSVATLGQPREDRVPSSRMAAETIPMIEELMELLDFHGHSRVKFTLEPEEIKFQKLVVMLKHILKTQTALQRQGKQERATGKHGQPERAARAAAEGGINESFHRSSAKRSTDQSRDSALAVGSSWNDELTKLRIVMRVMKYEQLEGGRQSSLRLEETPRDPAASDRIGAAGETDRSQPKREAGRKPSPSAEGRDTLWSTAPAA